MKKQVFITHGWKSLQFYQELRPDGVYQFFAHMAQDGEELYTGDTYVFDGPTLVAFMEGVSFRRSQRVPTRPSWRPS
jgi:hypothetical protein